MAASATLLPARSAKNRKIKKNEIALASFPRSGSTWIRNILMHLALAKDDLNIKIDFGTVEKIVPFDKIRQEFNLSPVRLKSFPSIIKTNDLYKKSGRTIYIIRDPRDTLVSFFYFEKYYLKKIGNEMLIGEYVTKKIDSWCRHIKSWQGHWGVLVVYEELHRHPEKEVRKILDYLKVKAFPGEIKKAVRKSSFGRMKKMETSFRKRLGLGKAGDDTRSFIVRKGEIGQWRHELGAADLRFMERRIKHYKLDEFLASLGYKFLN